MKPFAFIFPGQGSQSVGMLDAWGDHPVVAEVLQEASQALGEDVAKLIHEGPKRILGLNDQYPTGDVGRRCCGVSGVDGGSGYCACCSGWSFAG